MSGCRSSLWSPEPRNKTEKLKPLIRGEGSGGASDRGELGAERTDGSEQAEEYERAEFTHETAAFVDQTGSHLQLM